MTQYQVGVHSVKIPIALRARVDDWRAQLRPIPSFSTSLRQLMLAGLEAEGIEVSDEERKVILKSQR